MTEDFAVSVWNLMEHPNLNSSVTSEPSDIGNWFASYKYESPAMDLGSFRHGFDSGESERGADGWGSCGFKEIGNKGGVFVHGKLDSDGNKVSGISESPSSLLEPTDIRNWFSSYAYESPLLHETTGFGDQNSMRKDEEELRSSSLKTSISKEVVGEKEQSRGLSNCDGSWRVTKPARQPVCEAPDPLESPLILSEPSHIKNWFSSYVYESPSLDTYDNFEDSVVKESVREKDEYSVEIRKRVIEEDLGEFRKSSIVEDLVDEKEVSVGLAGCDGSFWRNTKHDRQPVHEVQDPLGSSSHLSEPTDIRNWFSSYVYESPSLDPADGVGDLVCRDKIDVEDDLSVENTNREKEKNSRVFGKKKSDGDEVDVKQVQLEEYVKVNTYCRLMPVDGTNRLDENTSSRSDLRLKYTPKEMHISPTPGDTLNREDSQRKLLDHEIFHGSELKPSKNQRSPCCNDGKWPRWRQDLIHNKASTLQESSEANVYTEKCSLPETNLELNQVNKGSVSKSTHGSKERKDKDGFVTTRKRKCTAKNDENSSTVAPVCRKEVVIERRKVLAETTNYHHSPATMISGKWKCPQQRKPNLGPPMKQLGLENWFRNS